MPDLRVSELRIGHWLDGLERMNAAWRLAARFSTPVNISKLSSRPCKYSAATSTSPSDPRPCDVERPTLPFLLVRSVSSPKLGWTWAVNTVLWSVTNPPATPDAVHFKKVAKWARFATRIMARSNGGTAPYGTIRRCYQEQGDFGGLRVPGISPLHGGTVNFADLGDPVIFVIGAVGDPIKLYVDWQHVSRPMR